MDESTANFLRVLNERNAAIAADEVKKKAEQEALKQARTDPIRLQREQERREKWGALRARERLSNRPVRVRHVFDYIDLS